MNEKFIYLTGKCKEDFEKFILKEYEDFGYVPIKDDYFQAQEDSDFIFEFRTLPFDLKLGGYLSFFNKNSQMIWISPYFNHDLGVMNEWAGFTREGIFTASYKTYKEAAIECILNMNELYNK